MEELLAAIVDNDCSRVDRLLKRDSNLAIRLIKNPRLYQKGISHWLYAGDTALHLAAAGYRVDIARLLLRAGADSNANANHRKSTPLHYAADGCITGPVWDSQKQVRMLRALLDAGAKINAQDANGATPLHRAVRTRRAAAVRFLLQAGSDPFLKNMPGSMPFHLAVQNTGRGGSGAPVAIAAQREIIKEFLSRGISVGLKTAGGKTVLDCARSAWIRELLAGAKDRINS
jgi:ankyrin repeat protein